jgi:hypothetical protein
VAGGLQRGDLSFEVISHADDVGHPIGYKQIGGPWIAVPR